MKQSKNFPFHGAPSHTPESDSRPRVAPPRAFADAILPPDDGGICDETECRKSGFSDAETKHLGRPETDGDTPATDTVDLHEISNCTTDKARECLERFLRAKIVADAREIKIIHGHGRGRKSADAGILRRKIRHWLSRSEWILAFAEPRDNRGCTRVRLRRRR